MAGVRSNRSDLVGGRERNHVGHPDIQVPLAFQVAEDQAGLRGNLQVRNIECLARGVGKYNRRIVSDLVNPDGRST